MISKYNLKKALFLLFLLSAAVEWFGCDLKTLTTKKKIEINNLSLVHQNIDLQGDLYQDNIQPLFDKRCVVCHSCYNSPCQVKLSSYEGAQRGGSKIKVYDGTRLKAIAPTRLFQDAHSEGEWRKKGFYSVLKGEDSRHASFMEQLVALKKKFIIDKDHYYEFYPEAEDLTCSADQNELEKFIKTNPHKGMPFGFPPLSQEEENILSYWLAQGAPGPAPERLLKMNSPAHQKGRSVIQQWERFLNGASIKEQIMSRYIYEHLFLAHIQFAELPGENYRLVRSRTAAPFPIDEIATVRPYDNPNVKRVYYRFKKIISTIVHKTHITYPLSLARIAEFKKIFLKPKWNGPYSLPSYSTKTAANPFKAFHMIPAKSRYEFLLRNNHYFVMTFIRGPVCKGQLALNSIRDHFSVVFMDPKYDLYVNDRKFEKRSIDYLATPILGKSNFLKSFYYKYHMLEQKYVELRNQAYAKAYPQGTDFNFIWAGDKQNSAVLTVYRHLDSGTVVAGQWGGIPKTMWVIDYPLFERIYYTLVAGFNVFGNISHQLFVRTYMDDMRIEGEDNFLSFIPRDKRLFLHHNWHKGDEIFAQFYFFWERKLSNALGVDYGGKVNTKIAYHSNQFVREFLQQFFDIRLKQDYAKRDYINNHSLQRTNLTNVSFSECKNEQCVDDSFRKITNRYGEFVRAFPEERLDLMFIRVRMPSGKHLVYTMVKNKAHLNVDTLFNEDGSRNPNQDVFNVFKGFLGSYPNLFFDVALSDIKEFFEEMVTLKSGDNSFYEFVDNYGVRRLDPQFWELSDWFIDEFKRVSPAIAGIFDLNRYANIPKYYGQKVSAK